MNNLTRFVLYARKSSEREDRQVQSINDQINFWKKKAQEEGIEIIKVYTEEKSAKTPWVRKAFYEMCEELEKWYADGVLCWKLDRLSRNPIDTGTIQYMLQRGKLKRIITSDRVYYPEDSGLIFSVETGMANQYILDLSKNSKRGLQSKLAKWHFPWMASQWYINDQINRTIIKDTERFEMVKKMWEMLLTGCYIPSKILDIANNDWGYRTLKRPKSGWKPLTLSTLYDLFKNPFYAGKMRYMGKVVDGAHEPMISWEEYLKAQKLIGFWKWVDHNIQPERPSVNIHSFAGVVVCGECGCMVTGETHTKILQTTKEMKSYTYYHCTHKRDTRELKCSQRKNISDIELEKQITTILESLEVVPEFFEWAKWVLTRRHSEETQGREWIFESVNKAIESAEKKKNRLLQMRLNGDFDGNYGEYDKNKQEIETEIQSLQMRRQELEKESVNWTDLVERTFDFAMYARDAFKNGDIEKKKLIFRSLGSNWVLKDGKLQANLHDWFLPFQNIEKFDSSPLQRLELTEKGISLGKTNAFDDQIMKWWRDPDLNRGHMDFQSIALPTELSRQNREWLNYRDRGLESKSKIKNL